MRLRKITILFLFNKLTSLKTFWLVRHKPTPFPFTNLTRSCTNLEGMGIVLTPISLPKGLSLEVSWSSWGRRANWKEKTFMKGMRNLWNNCMAKLPISTERSLLKNIRRLEIRIVRKLEDIRVLGLAMDKFWKMGLWPKNRRSNYPKLKKQKR